MSAARWTLVLTLAAAGIAVPRLVRADGAQGIAPTQSTATPATRYLVMPFDVDTRDPQSAWLGEAVAILLMDTLNTSGAFAFTRDERVSAFEYFNLLPTATVSRATTLRIARALGATDVIVGAVDVEGSTLAIHLRRLSLDVGRFVADAHVDGRPDRLGAAVDELAAQAKVKGPRRASPSVMEPQAFELYVRGLLSQNPARQIALLDSALAGAPRDVRIRRALWDAHTSRGNAELALRAVDPVGRDWGGYRLARFLKALSLVELDRLDEAFAVFDQLNAEQSTGPLLNNLGVLQLRRARAAHEGSSTYFLTKASELEPDDPDVCFNLGYAYYLEKQLDAASYWLREAVRRNPADGDAHAVLAYVLHATGAGAQADREWELARLLSERYADVSSRPVALPGEVERIARDLEIPRIQSLAAALREPAGRQQGEVASFHLDRGRRLVQEAKDGEAVIELRKAIYLSPYDAETHMWLGRAYRKLGQLRQAVDALRVSVWCSDGAEARLELAELLFELKDVDRARAELARARTLSPDSPRARALEQRLTTREP